VREADSIIPKLVDFGISTAEVERHDRRRPTGPGAGAMMGTPWYMSPEQARREDPDRRSDIYSIGVIVYEALVGEAPFDDPELARLLDQVQAGGAPPLLTRRPELGEELSAAIERAMAVDPGGRFESAAELAARLEELAERVPPELLCTAPTTVSRTDTDLVSRAPRPRTRELGSLGGLTRPMAPWRGRRSWLALGAAALALIAWLGFRPAPAPQPAAQASVVPPGRATAEGTLDARVARNERTFTGPGANPTVTAIPEGDRKPARRWRGERGHGRVAVPDVFRTPGF
jgi:hypothetical protein